MHIDPIAVCLSDQSPLPVGRLDRSTHTVTISTRAPLEQQLQAAAIAQAMADAAIVTAATRSAIPVLGPDVVTIT